MDLGLKGLRAVLAGASKGIGRATAEVLAAEGCDVAICARGAEGVDEAVASLKAHGGKVLGESVDMTDAEAYAAWIKRAAVGLGGCDIFISFASAGGGGGGEERWRAHFEIDVLSTVRGVEAALPFLEQSKAGAIVAVATTAALEDFFGPQPYNALKAAVINYASNLSQALAPKGIRVNTISPGAVFIKDGAWDRIKAGRPEVYDSIVAKVPMGRLGQGDEIARTIAFMASPAAGFMTGANVVVDGGLTTRVQY